MLVVLAVLFVALLSLADDPPEDRIAGPPFPRTAVYFLEHENLPSAQEFARYDVVVLDSEWVNRRGPDFFTAIREHNPDIVLLAYVNMVDHPPRLGSPEMWADRYALWQFETPTQSRFPEQWLARSADGKLVSEWPNTVMTNLTDVAPRVNGQTFAEYAADWVVDQVWASGVWDGIFLDVWGDYIYGASVDRWDINRDGTDEHESEIYGPGMPWERGVDAAERRMRERMPDAILIANGNRTVRDQQLNGRVWENFADERIGREPEFDLREYVTVTAEADHQLPRMAMTINNQRAIPGSAEDLQRARFFLTGTLLQDGYWAAMGPDYGTLANYDELSLDPGYLGYPLVPNPSPAQLEKPFSEGIGQLADRLFRRDFEHGIVLHNISDVTHTASLDGPYRRLDTDAGEVGPVVTIAPRDGVILLRD